MVECSSAKYSQVEQWESVGEPSRVKESHGTMEWSHGRV